jgi:hypothetical protein
MKQLLYCYHIPPIDFWVGALAPAEFLAAAARSVEHEWVVGEISELCAQIAILEHTARDAFARIGWEGDITSGPYLFAIPSDCSMLIGYALKQSNNGSCFVAAPCELPHLATFGGETLVVELPE